MAKKQPPEASVPPAAAPTTPPKKKGKQEPKSASSAPAVAVPPPPAAVEKLRARVDTASWPEDVIDQCVSEALTRMSSGESLVAVAEDLGVPLPSLYRWFDRDPAGYERARQERAHALFEKLQRVADEAPPVTQFGTTDSGAVADKRLRVDTYKWMASKLLPKNYGDKLELGGKLEISLAERLKSLSTSPPAVTHAPLPRDA